ncbi:auxin-responsive protein IAA18-like isoform X2 [Salvia miltiorrhiza]|uniref:auxin-responsive protein IAA18-like isoform X2 n=1 Tax=Salvia miltiorrhiza TaxID=226208 RepID=UPI0025AC5FBB|nr:auxin-responsive protein IAA18-like isoform X2 [Salvia miltiorrhiza]
MENYSRKDEGCPQLLDLIPKDRETWVTKRAEERRSHGISEEKKLELRLGPPGGEWAIKESNSTASRERLLSLGHFPTSPCAQNPVLQPPSPWQHHHLHSSYLHLQPGQGQIAVSKESSKPCSNRAAAVEHSAAAEKKAFSAANTAVHNSSGTAQKRTAPASVVGWPPIRSFRKNIASGSSSKQASDSPEAAASPSKVLTPKSGENCSRTPFVKINMDGIPIGRKVDLKAYNTYEKLSFAVDELFRGLLAAQKKSCGVGIKDEGDGVEKIGGLLDGSGEYTLVYEDHEGDRMLVGDVPWHMFVSTVKRLRVLKSSELPTLSRGRKQGKLSINV